MDNSEHNLDGQWALITGAGKRIGAAVARSLHQAGAGVAIHYRGSSGNAEALASELNALRAGSAITAQADLLETPRLQGFVDRVIDQTGRLDILVNNASTFYPTPLDEVTEAHWDDLMGTNLKAPMFLTQAVAPQLRQHHGCIVNLIDIHAMRPLRHHTVYGPAKAALAMLTRTLARDLAPEVRVNGVSPGAILWPDDGMEAKVKESILRQVPLRRAGEPQDIADCVLFLVRDARYVTGQIIAVDGGRSIGW